MQDTRKYTSPYSLDGRIPLRQAIPLGLQHVLAIILNILIPRDTDQLEDVGRLR